MELYLINLSREITTYAVIVLLVVYYFFTSCYNYWKDKNFLYLTPTFPSGNNQTLFCKKPDASFGYFDHYQEIRKKGCKFAGIHFFHRPILMITDPGIAMDILLKDFNYFMDRGFYKNSSDPLSVHLFSMDSPLWRTTRMKLTPNFTSGKTKMMLPSIISVTETMMGKISDASVNNSDIDIKQISTEFTINSLAICALGIEPGDTEKSNIFLKQVQKYLDNASFTDVLRLSFMKKFPHLSYKLGVRLLRKEVAVFFKNVMADCVRFRDENRQTRLDFLDLLMSIRNEMKHTSGPFTDDQMIAEVFDLFLASLDTSSNTITFALFELAKEYKMQERLRSEMNRVLEKHNGRIDTNSLVEMKYLHQIIDETLRLYPPSPTLERRCIKNYKIEGSELIKKGTFIAISVFGIHRDPEYYSDPEKYDPERFNKENKGNIKSKTYLPFGSGPKKCIGLRFDYMLVQVALIKILTKYRITISNSTRLPLEIDKQCSMITLKTPILFKSEKIQDN